MPYASLTYAKSAAKMLKIAQKSLKLAQNRSKPQPCNDSCAFVSPIHQNRRPDVQIPPQYSNILAILREFGANIQYQSLESSKTILSRCLTALEHYGQRYGLRNGQGARNRVTGPVTRYERVTRPVTGPVTALRAGYRPRNACISGNARNGHVARYGARNAARNAPVCGDRPP